ncbi:MAG: dual specificity protein phosphatase family protein [Bacteroidales bacterium]|nr:dual specificity protein phosphatase family protein [Bacteroidales bacterium]
MKTIFTYSMIAVWLSLFCINPVISKSVSADKPALDSAQKVEQFKGMYKAGDYYFGGQPTLEAIKYLKSEGVKLFINLRTENENQSFTNTVFNEENLLKKYEINYISIPVSYPDSYNAETLAKFKQALSENENKVFIHCAGGGRVKTFFMAYLIEVKGYTINEAMSWGNELNYYFPLGILLEKEIDMTFKK